MRYFSSVAQIVLVFVIAFSACSSGQIKDDTIGDGQPNDSSKILIVYLSRTSNTKAVAEMIRGKIGGDLVALELVKPYPENYRATVEQVARENESGFLPTLKTRINNIGSYDLMFVGFPTWGMQLPPPVKSFLKATDLKGKIVVPFNTNAGYGPGNSFETIKSYCPESKVLEGFTTKGGVERDNVLLDIKEERHKVVEKEVHDWVQKIRLHFIHSK